MVTTPKYKNGLLALNGEVDEDALDKDVIDDDDFGMDEEEKDE